MSDWNAVQQAKIIATHLSLSVSDAVLVEGYLRRAFAAGAADSHSCDLEHAGSRAYDAGDYQEHGKRVWRE